MSRHAATADSAGEVHDLGDGVYQLPTDYPEVCNAPLWSYLLSDAERFALIDPGVRSTMGATLATAVEGLGFGLDRADLLLATHGHPDHSGGQSSWAAVAPRARIAAPLEDVPWVESFDRQWARFWDDYPGTLDLAGSKSWLAGMCVPEPKVDLMLRDGDCVEIGDRAIDVVETRGHTWGHCAFYDRRSGSLFSGDAVQGRGTPSCDGRTVFAPLYVDVADARSGLNRLLALPFDRLCPAHAPPMSRDAGIDLLLESLAFIDEVEAMARALVARSGPAPLLTSELAIAIAGMTGTDPPLTAQTVPTARAHLYALAREGLIDAAWVRRPKAPAGE
jgi:glyoxylase-like metal-dependent hydrolase (beta-lactamase superfamily II)